VLAKLHAFILLLVLLLNCAVLGFAYFFLSFLFGLTTPRLDAGQGGGHAGSTTSSVGRVALSLGGIGFDLVRLIVN
jgi:hypothetical protein